MTPKFRETKDELLYYCNKKFSWFPIEQMQDNLLYSKEKQVEVEVEPVVEVEIEVEAKPKPTKKRKYAKKNKEV